MCTLFDESKLYLSSIRPFFLSEILIKVSDKITILELQLKKKKLHL